MVEFGQLVIGSPGAGKTTFCDAMLELLTALGRECIIVNLDFANDWRQKKTYQKNNASNTDSQFSILEADVDVRDLLTVESVMDTEQLGPNGALIYCQRRLRDEVNWLKNQMQLAKKRKNIINAYFLIDCPGQVELYTVDHSLQEIFSIINDHERGLRLATVHLIDSSACQAPHLYISALLLSLSAQIHLNFPFVNLFSKIDLLKEKELEFDLEYYCRSEDLEYLIANANSGYYDQNSASYKYKKRLVDLESEIANLVSTYSLLSFRPVSVLDRNLMLETLQHIDQTIGFY